MANLKKRAEMVKAMEVLARSCNAEDYLMSWLLVGVADGDINSDTTLQEIAELGYCDDDTFKELMDAFIKIMFNAAKDGGLYCDGIVSVERRVEVNWE